jgi:hypothetical protein
LVVQPLGIDAGAHRSDICSSEEQLLVYSKTVFSPLCHTASFASILCSNHCLLRLLICLALHPFPLLVAHACCIMHRADACLPSIDSLSFRDFF